MILSMILDCVQSIDWNVVNNILSSLASIAVIVVAVWGARQWQREFVGKRRIQLAEDTLTAFFAVKDAIGFIRNPWGSVDEGSTREKRDDESAEETDRLNRAYVFAERYTKKAEVFSQFRGLKHRFMATFGKDTEDVFAGIEEILWKMDDASHERHALENVLCRQDDIEKRKQISDKMESLQDVFWQRHGRPDNIKDELDKIQRKLEEVTNRVICQ